MVSVAAIINVDDINGADSLSANAGDVKKSTIALIAHRLSELAPHLCQNMLRRSNLPSLTASFSVISNVDDMNGAYSQSAD